MNRAQKIIQAYTNTPWWRQAQIIGTFAAFGVVVAMVMITYIWISSNAGTYGLQVQEIQETNQALQKEIEDKKAELANITSSGPMATRASEMGFVPVNPERIRYLTVSGYPAQVTPEIPGASAPQEPAQNELPPEYTTSLLEWFQAFIYKLSLKTGSALAGEE